MRLLLPCLTMLLVAALSSCGGSDDAAPKAKVSEPQTVEVSGELQLLDASGVDEAPDNSYECVGDGGYSDINAGAQVTVYDAAGEALALGTLGTGLMTEDGYVVPCVFAFKVPDVPTDGSVFSIEVSHRGKVNFTKDQLADHVVLTLGERA